MEYNSGKQDPFQPPQHQATQYLDQQRQYSGVVYTEGQQQYSHGQQQLQTTGYQQPQSPGPLNHQNTIPNTQNPPGINPVPAPAHIQPDAPPKALTQAQVTAITAQQVAQQYPGASIHYVPRLSVPDEFHYTMCGCFSDFFTCKHMSTCCCGTWCPCILYSRIHYRLRARNPKDMNGFSSCNGQCWSSFCMGTAVHSRQRDEIRHRYRLSGSCCGDCFRHSCCGPCTLCQEEKEVKYREEELENLVKAGNYQSSQQMVYPSQTKAQ